MNKIKALVVDDSVTIRKIIKANLNKLGITTVHEANNGMEGYRLAVTTPLDIAFVDFNMPELNGLEMTEKLRADARTTELKIVAVSSGFDNVIIDRFKELGVFDFIDKPFDITKFNNAIKPILVKEASGEKSQDGTKLTPEILTRLFSQTPQIDIDDTLMSFKFGNEKVTIPIDRFVTFASHFLDIPEEATNEAGE